MLPSWNGKGSAPRSWPPPDKVFAMDISRKTYRLVLSVDEPCHVTVSETEHFLEVDGIDMQTVRLPKDHACLDALAELIAQIINQEGVADCCLGRPGE